MVYGRETFCADMMTTQRSESMNNVLKNYVSYKHDLVRFFQHFERLIDDRRYEELTTDFKATQSSLKLSINIEILNHASSIYTQAIFKMFQAELGKAYDCILSICERDGNDDGDCDGEMLTKYMVTHHKKRFHHSVEFNSSNSIVQCSCKKFEFAGILCSHALKVLSSKNVLKIPDQYILKRWTKYAKYGETKVAKFSINENAKADLEDVEARLRGMNVQNSTSSNYHANLPTNSDGNIMHEKIKGVKANGRPRGKSTRFKSALERATKKKNKVQNNASSSQDVASFYFPSTQMTPTCSYSFPTTHHNSSSYSFKPTHQNPSTYTFPYYPLLHLPQLHLNQPYPQVSFYVSSEDAIDKTTIVAQQERILKRSDDYNIIIFNFILLSFFDL
ncbi:protein FAR1-RELATED SEQUENCE 1-like [Humulus lupulus]|uniref:protein FAR1-RELATED SEQUENCE 1-like n=1 Tax=Humulus lupulus TaxID=3486 RepID=UPI002B41731F|nr:protein FAR1-RELATED SEQUENCE 1-like [Humulus lupulus]